MVFPSLGARKILVGAAALMLAGCMSRAVWKLDELPRVGGHETEIIGAPRLADGAVAFDGAHDGLLVSANPLAGLKAWTMEILFSPAADGGEAQRFVHAQDAAGRRALVELRLDGKGGWWLDTYLGGAATGSGTTLIDPKRVHPTGRWYWAALRFDGKKMTDFVNGAPELEGEATWGPMGEGKISLGVRQNKVYWFKGAIREVRFTPAALPAEKLQRVK